MKDSSSYFPPTSVGLEKSEAPNHSETLKLKEATDSATSWEALPARARLSKMDYKVSSPIHLSLSLRIC